MFKCVFVTTYYPSFINSVYHNHPGLEQESYNQQLSFLQSLCFGDSDFYSYWFRKQGIDAEDIVFNCEHLQNSWARENSFRGRPIEILLQQLKALRPDIIYFHDMNLLTREVFFEIKDLASLIVGQIASKVHQRIFIDGFDLIISSLPNLVQGFRQKGKCSYYLPLAFDHRIANKLNIDETKQYDITFIGGITDAHSGSTALLEYLCQHTNILIWGYGIDLLPADSLIRNRHQGELWGKDMFRVLHQSRITLNRHINTAENYANNMRLFEATGSGALLLTDYKNNLSELFSIGDELLAYRSPEEAMELINYFLENKDEITKISHNGYMKTLEHHTYEKRMWELSDILYRHLRYKNQFSHIKIDYSKISSDYSQMSESTITDELLNGWKSDLIPIQQRALTNKEIYDMFSNKIPLPYHVLITILKRIVNTRDSILEIGCSTGYYSEVINYLLPKSITYSGVDYSYSMIKLAKEYYPNQNFLVADGAFLCLKDRTFDIVISGGVILHCKNYNEHIIESVRVSKKYIVFHRTPVCRNRKTFVSKKRAYGIETIEYTFNEDELHTIFCQMNLIILHREEFESFPEQDNYTISYTLERH